MATPFDSFDRSPLDAFVQSPLQARGLLASSISRTVALTFGVTPTPSAAKYPLYASFVPGTRYVRRYQDVGGTLVLYSQFTLGGGGDLLPGSGAIGGGFWEVVRQRTTAVAVPSGLPSSAYWRARVQTIVPPNAVPADVFMANQASACDFNGPAVSWFLGTALPGVDNRFDPGPLTPGQSYYLFVRVQNDMSYIDLGNGQYYQFRANNNGVSIRLETYV